MRKYHNLGTVLKHEYVATVKQPVFWITIISLPLLMLLIGGISYLSNNSAKNHVEQASQHIENTVIVDQANIISPALAQAAKIKLQPNKQTAIDDVKNGSLSAAIIYPGDILKSRNVEIATNVTDTTTQGAYQKLAQDLLKGSILAPLGSDERAQLVLNNVNANITTYKNGVAQKGWADYIVPGAFLVLFYAIIIFSSNLMLTSVSEEKENRAMELILTSIRSRTLIIGKLLGMSLVALTQIALLIGLSLAIFLVAKQFVNDLSLPFNLNDLVFNPERIAFGAVFLVLGFLQFAALMAGTGAIVPTAKEASGLSTIFIFGAIIPFYAVTFIMTQPDALVTKVFTFFPLTSPVTLLMRNTVGNISMPEALLAGVVLAASTLFAFWLAGRLFARGALEYNNRLSLKDIIK